MKKISSLLLFLSIFSLNLSAVNLTGWIGKQRIDQKPFVISSYDKIIYTRSPQFWHDLTPKMNQIDTSWTYIGRLAHLKLQKRRAEKPIIAAELKRLKKEENRDKEKKSNETKQSSLGHS